MKLVLDRVSAVIKDTQKEVLKDFELSVRDGEIHAIMGPNGTGKSTLSKLIMGSDQYQLTEGDILVDQQSILSLTTDERARLGIFLAMQDPTVVEGVTNSEFLKTALSEKTGQKVSLYHFMKKVEGSITDLHMDSQMLHRFINASFSGGEKKKNEILQLKILEPSFIILDEIDSGLDVDSLRVVCDNLRQYKEDHPNTSILIITHYPRILHELKPDYVHILMNGTIQQTGDFMLAEQIEKEGYHRVNEVGEMAPHE